MNHYTWNKEKNEKLKIERGISFEQIAMHVEQGDVLDIVDHPNQKKYPNQQLLVVETNKYAYLVPFFEDENSKFLQTIIPSRKATLYHLEGKNE
jgi:uncharacterized DUF497 family protein